MSISLYSKYGGVETVSLVVHKFYKQIQASQLLMPYFVGIDIDGLINHQVKFFSYVMGGIDGYDMSNFKNAHFKFKISEEAFAEVINILRTTLEEFSVENEDINSIVNSAMGLKDRVVNPN
jgi:hemoglobin